MTIRTRISRSAEECGERLRKIAKAPPPKREKEEAAGRVTRASYSETSKKELSEIGSLSLR